MVKYGGGCGKDNVSMLRYIYKPRDHLIKKKGKWNTYLPVSYTHLDVYKRQDWELDKKYINKQKKEMDLVRHSTKSVSQFKGYLLCTSRCV